jgi:uncharacterized RDD family membrane protein YckC
MSNEPPSPGPGRPPEDDEPFGRPPPPDRAPSPPPGADAPRGSPRFGTDGPAPQEGGPAGGSKERGSKRAHWETLFRGRPLNGKSRVNERGRLDEKGSLNRKGRLNGKGSPKLARRNAGLRKGGPQPGPRRGADPRENGSPGAGPGAWPGEPGPGGGGPGDRPGEGGGPFGGVPGGGGPPPGGPPPGGGAPYGPPDPLAGMAPLAPSGIRVLARIVDIVIVGVVAFLLTLGFGLATAHAGSGQVRFGRSFGESVLVAVLYIAYDSYLISRTGQTVGKRLFHLRVADLSDGSTPSAQVSLTRAAVLWLPFAFCCACVWTAIAGGWSFFDRPYKQGLHDKAARTVVVRTD